MLPTTGRKLALDGNEPQRIRILVADDHPLIRTALRTFLEREPEFEIVGEAGDGAEAVRLAEQLLPDIVIMDVGMPVMDGVEATQLIKSSNPSTLVLILTVHTDPETIVSLMRSGASGYLVKSIFGPEVNRTIKTLMDGDVVIAPGIMAEIINHLRLHEEEPTKPQKIEPSAKLSAKGMEVLALATRGLSNKEIGAILGITEATVKSHFVEIFRNLNVRSRTEAIFVALQPGMLNLDDLANAES